MSVRFDHTLVASADKHRSARFFAAVFGLPEPVEAGFFVAVTLGDGALMSFAQAPPGAEIHGQHYAFLVDEAVFDGVVARLEQQGIAYWADPRKSRPGQISSDGGARAVYFDDPDGHHLEARTCREGSGQ
ncbi:MAG TPA: VOC family protein [Roseiflexaceae bacterium]|nr:VOC family protein [Roseiflexaceae bacterium]